MKRAMPILRLPALFLCLAALTVLSCDPKTGNLSVSIISQPTGGSYVTMVSCTFEGTATDAMGGDDDFPDPIVLTATWHSSHGTYPGGTVAWTHGGQYQTKTVSKSAPSGMHLDKPFWCELTWKDAEGGHLIVSDTAYCE